MSTATLNPPRPHAILPLQPGDRLDRVEFERRFDATPELKKAELIEGVVYMPPPVGYEYHSRPHFTFQGLFWVYSTTTPGVNGGDNSSIRLDMDNMPQPDSFLFLDTGHGGQSRIDEDGYIEGAPELVAEIAATTASYDLNQKMEVYRRFGVKEYIVWRTLEAAIDFFVLEDGQYQRRRPDADGIYRSRLFPGLWLNVTALLSNDSAAALGTLQDGLKQRK